MDFTERLLHSTASETIFFSAAKGNFSKIDPILGHKESFNKCKKIEVIFCLLSGHHNGIKLEINNKPLSLSLYKNQLEID
jgi:hypothetical protein